MPNKTLIEFYLGMKPYPGGATIKDMLQGWSYEQLESVHDYIQWLFPTLQKSQFNTNAPTLDEETIAAWKESVVLQSTLLDALNRMCAFYGLQLVQNVTPPQIVKAATYLERKSNWQDAAAGYLNHNLLRLSRIIDSLVTLGLPEYGAALFRCLEVIAKEEPDKIPAKTVAFWYQAAVRKFKLETKRREEREVLEGHQDCPDRLLEQAERMLWSAEHAVMLYEKRQRGFKALDLVDRAGNCEVTAQNLTQLRRVLYFLYKNCQYDGWDLRDILQVVQRKLEPGYEVATDMFGALYADACRFQLAQEVGYNFALSNALMALRSEIKLDIKQQILGSNNKNGIKKALLLVAEVYERTTDTKRATELTAVANELG